MTRLAITGRRPEQIATPDRLAARLRFGFTAAMLAMPLVPQPAQAFCSVFDEEPCIPEPDHPIGQELQLTITSRNAQGQAVDPERKLNTIRDIFAALRGCWLPPPKEEARDGMEISVRFAFRRNGTLLGEPRVTYASRGASPENRQTYRKAIFAALDRCTPAPFTKGLGGALAGRPFAVRYIDDRHKGP